MVFGDGGLVLTNDDEIYNKIILMRDHGRSEDGNISIWGYNSRLDNLQAGILNVFFKDYDKTVERRRQIAKLYHENLNTLNNIVLPPPPDEDSNHFDIFQNYEIETEKRDELKQHLSNNGIGTLIQWGGKAVMNLEIWDLNKYFLLLKTNEKQSDAAFKYDGNRRRRTYICDKVTLL